MEIRITMLNGNSLNLKVNPDFTVGSLKALIQQKLGFAPENQKLIFVNGQTITLSDDSRTIGSYGLHSGCQVSLLVTQPPQLPQPATIQVFLRNEKGKTRPFNIPTDETVRGFKLKVELKEGVPPDQQVLNYEGRVMDEGKLADYKVVADSIIYLTLRLRGG